MRSPQVSHFREVLLPWVTSGCLVGSALVLLTRSWGYFDGSIAFPPLLSWFVSVLGFGIATGLALARRVPEGARVLLFFGALTVAGGGLFEAPILAMLVMLVGSSILMLTAVSVLDDPPLAYTAGFPALHAAVVLTRQVLDPGQLVGPDVWAVSLGGGIGLLIMGEIARRGARALLGALDTSEHDREELRIARDHALDASRAKSTFLANMSHELRTPLNAILGYSELLLEDEIDSDPHELRAIHRAGSHLLAIIDDLLDLAKVEAGQLELHLREVEVAALVEAVAEQVRPQLQGRPIQMVVRVQDAGHAWLDETRVRQILLNLLGNASKFTQKGEIRLFVRGEPDRLWLEVADSGVGIPSELVAQVFEPFVQGIARRGGVGLGLTITRDLVELMGGVIDLHSAPGEGTRVSVRLPRDVRPARRLEQGPRELAHPLAHLSAAGGGKAK